MASYSPKKSIRKFAKIRLNFTFSCNYVYLCDVYLRTSFCYGFILKGMGANNRFPECSSGVMDTAGSDPAFSLTPRDLILHYHWHHGIGSCGVNDTGWILLPLSHWDYRIFYKNVQVRSLGIIDTAEFELFERLSRFSRLIRSHMRNGFSLWMRALGGIVWWKKTEGWKSRNTVLLNGILNIKVCEIRTCLVILGLKLCFL
jgi:hypothetical protein